MDKCVLPINTRKATQMTNRAKKVAKCLPKIQGGSGGV